MSFNNVAIIYVKGNAYKIHFWYMSKDDAINIMNSSNLVYKMGVLWKIKYKKSAIWLIKKSRNVILNRAKDFYENDKERLREQATDKYRNLSEEEINKKREYGKSR